MKIHVWQGVGWVHVPGEDKVGGCVPHLHYTWLIERRVRSIVLTYRASPIRNKTSSMAALYNVAKQNGNKRYSVRQEMDRVTFWHHVLLDW